MTHPLLSNLTVRFSDGWTGIVGANGTGKSTLMKLAAGLLTPDSGEIHASGTVQYGEQRTDVMPPQLIDLLQDTDGEALSLTAELEIGDDWPGRWDSLSHGERKRAQIAVMLWLQPTVLALDEPSNHIDGETREMLIGALRRFRGVGLLVSHDRELLDTLCRQCLFLDPPDYRLRPGGVTQGMEQDRLERDAVHDEADRLKHQMVHLQRENQRRRELADQAMAKNTKSGLSSKDHDQRDKIRLGRITGKDAVGAKTVGQMSGRLRQIQDALADIHVKKEYKTGIWLKDGGCSKRSFLFHLEAGTIPLGADQSLQIPELYMNVHDRIALTGNNGAGKSSFLHYALQHLNVEPDKLVYIPQEITADEASQLLQSVKSLSKEELGLLMTTISQLGSRPQRLMESLQPSPGETRKLLLALGITKGPHLIVMDEPTNHMDLPSILCLQEALQDCPCGLLLVSHDRSFLQSVTEKEWHIDHDGTSHILRT